MKFSKVFALPLALMMLLSGCGGSGAEDVAVGGEKKNTFLNSNTPVRLSEDTHSVFYAPQYVAQELGFFEEEGLDVTVDVGNGLYEPMTALLSGSADVALMGIEAGIYVYNEGLEEHPKAFAQLTQRAGEYLVSREEDPDFAWTDLKGKSVIGRQLGSMTELVLECIIVENGMNLRDVDVITNIDIASTKEAFLENMGDYTIASESLAMELERSGEGYIVASLGGESETIPYTVYMANYETMTEKSDVIEAFARAIDRGQEWVTSHSSAEIAEVIKPQFPEFDTKTLITIIERYKELDVWKTNHAVDPVGFERILDIMEMGGELWQRVDYDDLVMTDFAVIDQ